MKAWRRWWCRFGKREDGATATEYAVVLAIILAAFVAVQAVGSALQQSYANSGAQLPGGGGSGS